jgi:hypothetical protein
VSFNPADRSQLATGGPGGLTIWKMSHLLNDYTAVPVVAAAIPAERETGVTDAQYVGVTAHCWALEGQILQANGAGELLIINAHSGEVLERLLLVDTLQWPEWRAVSLILTLTHVVVTTLDGEVMWHSLKDLSRVERSAVINQDGGDTIVSVSW